MPEHSRVYRPWGYYRIIDVGERFQVKRLCVDPGKRLSLQLHRQRAEHWLVVQGVARVLRGDKSIILNENEAASIPIGVRHGLENPGQSDLHLIEIQFGEYLGEDDIVRFEDDFGRD